METDTVVMDAMTMLALSGTHQKIPNVGDFDLAAATTVAARLQRNQKHINDFNRELLYCQS